MPITFFSLPSRLQLKKNWTHWEMRFLGHLGTVEKSVHGAGEGVVVLGQGGA